MPFCIEGIESLLKSISCIKKAFHLSYAAWTGRAREAAQSAIVAEPIYSARFPQKISAGRRRVRRKPVCPVVLD